MPATLPTPPRRSEHRRQLPSAGDLPPPSADTFDSGLVRYGKLQVRQAAQVQPGAAGATHQPYRIWSHIGQRATTPGAWSNTRTSAIGPVRTHSVQRPMAVVTSTRNTSWRGSASAVPSVDRLEPVMVTSVNSRSVLSRSIAPVPLLLPRVAVVVVAQARPEARSRAPTWRSSTGTGGAPAAAPGHHARPPGPHRRSGTRSTPCRR